ncbi:hypothetical protein AArc1_5130 (plasmid) [Natrarchaeobaculum sulfurireducens]|uniref:Uncharacterized protein n=1 Tax=Natrarchaeobaculum sulfurireducens TaxID=2044521 RepID=A0A346P9Y6_9EURY|nr:hypothetical protein AArc1_5130 [Natrarchaeobaculum sulfurireducens]
MALEVPTRTQVKSAAARKTQSFNGPRELGSRSNPGKISFSLLCRAVSGSTGSFERYLAPFVSRGGSALSNHLIGIRIITVGTIAGSPPLVDRGRRLTASVASRATRSHTKTLAGRIRHPLSVVRDRVVRSTPPVRSSDPTERRNTRHSLEDGGIRLERYHATSKSSIHELDAGKQSDELLW